MKVSSGKLPAGFNGYRIVHISDLHGKLFGKNQIDLISKIKAAKPDMIAITGDLISYDEHNIVNAVTLINGITGIAPVYYVTGNHECLRPDLEEFLNKLEHNGVRVLRNHTARIQKDGDSLLLVGIDDPVFTHTTKDYISGKTVADELEQTLCNSKSSDYKILLSHRPEHFTLYSYYNIDLTLSGHAHGGQIRIPFVGGLIAPGQGFFPKYTSGKHLLGDSAMIVSRGLGNSSIPIRIFNRPEVVAITLYKN